MNAQELLWKYAENACDAAEMEVVRKLLAEQPSMQEELEMITRLQAALKGMEAEQPSMRFTKNVMEALPEIYTQTSVEPLVPLLWKKIFWSTVVIAFTLILLLPSHGTNSGFSIPFLDEIERSIYSLAGGMTGAGMTSFVLVFLTIATLMWADRYLSKRIGS